MISLGSITGRTGKDLEDLLDLVKNADKYEAKLKALKDAETKAIMAKEQLTKAQDLDAELKRVATLKAQTKELRDQAQALFNKAQEDAAIEKDKIIAAANLTASQYIKDAKAQWNDAEAVLKTAKESEAKAKEALEQAETKLTEITTARNDAASLKQDYETKLNQLNSMIKQAGL